MSLLDGMLWTVSLVMVASGALKLADPTATAATFRAIGIPGGAPSARCLGVCEVAVGLAALVVGSRVIALLVAVLYVGFAVVVLTARSRGLASCGCFGARSAPPRILHVVVNLGSALVALLAAGGAEAPVPVADGLDGRSFGIAIAIVVAVLCGAVGLILLESAGADRPT